MKTSVRSFLQRIIFTIGLVIYLPALSQAQDREPKFVYCQVVATEKAFSNKVTVELDFGQKMKFFADNRLKGEDGKAIKFNTNVDALNFMGRQGWEYQQSSTVAVDSGLGGVVLVHLTVMKKAFSDLDDEAKKEYLSK